MQRTATNASFVRFNCCGVKKGTVGQLYDVVETWQEKALNVQGKALPCGHSPQEEVPAIFLAQLQGFLDSVL